MVKTKAPLLLAYVALVSSCAPGAPSASARTQILELARGRLGRTVSLERAGASLVAVYSNWETTSLYAAELPLSDRLPDAPPPPRLIDKIDTTLPLSPTFGEHVSLGRGSDVSVLYLAREGEDKLVLKLASHAAGSSDWTLDVIEPPGSPVALLPSDSGRTEIMWATDALLGMTYPGSLPAVSMLSPFLPADRASVVRSGGDDEPDRPAGADLAAFPRRPGARGFTVYDAVSHGLLYFRWNGAAYAQTRVEGAGPVHSSVLLRDGALAVFSWDERTKRLSLVRVPADGSPVARSVVSLSEGTTAVSLLAKGSRLFFLYDEIRRMGGNRVLYELSLLVPGQGVQTGPGRLRRIVLASSDQPLSDFSALVASDELFVLLLQGSLKLMRLSLP
ncbi:MAG TPA: hypothetical protein VMV03_13945 [Spirochaetia bacterium]|nr:hypothetical protein [Spirochaetia bacterium]